MAEKKVIVTKTTSSAAVKKDPLTKTHTRPPLFYKENFIWMGVGAAIIALGMLLMSGGKNPNPNQFDYNVVYSARRITFGPILILIGLLTEIYAIFKKPKVQQY